MQIEKISELDALATADDSDVLVINDVSEEDTMKITKQNLLKEVNSDITTIEDNITTIENDIDDIQEDIGDISQLSTDVTTSLVDAINWIQPSAIVASSLGSSGYIKYANGFMFQWQTKSITTSVTAWGNAYYYDVTMSNWAVPFTTVFHSWTDSGHAQFWSTGGTATATSASIVRIVRPNSSNYSMAVTVFAIGLWK